MMLVQKQHPLHLPSHPMHLNHQRHSSIPSSIVAHPTNTPGLLSLSRPTKPTSQRPAHPKQSPKLRPAQSVRHGLLNAAEITDKKNAVRPSTTSPNISKAKPTSKQAMSDSEKISPPRPHGKPARHPSPPLPPSESSQAEAFHNPANSDPFLDFSSTKFNPTLPILAPRPSGKLARRRQSQQPSQTPDQFTATPTKAIPCPPRSRKDAPRFQPRSDPVRYDPEWQHVCDDAKAKDHPLSPPVTPIRHRQDFSDMDAPRTAPLSALGPHAFPFDDIYKFAPPKKTRNHKRTPSDGVFAMSSDDEASSGTEDLRALLNLVNIGSYPSPTQTPPPHRTVDPAYIRSLSPESREKFFELEAQKEVAAYFASSSFQNSPDPDDLPDPAFC